MSSMAQMFVDRIGGSMFVSFIGRLPFTCLLRWSPVRLVGRERLGASVRRRLGPMHW